MSENLPWLRLYHEIIDDDRLLSIAFEDRWHYVALMCCKAKGILDRTQSEEQLIRALCAKLGLDRASLTDVGRRLSAAGLLQNNSFQPTEGAMADLIGPHKTTRPAAHVWRALRDFVFRRDDYTCRYCGSRGGKLECDHVIPVSRGGEHDHSNLVTACLECNRSKRDKLVEEWVR